MRRINLLRAHGSPTCHQYRYYRCRCVACTKAKAAYDAAHYAACYAAHGADYREERAERSRRYYAEHPEGEAERSRKYRSEHPEEIAAKDRNRRALEANATGTHSAADIRAQYERQRGKCFWRKVHPACAVSLKGCYRIDHVIPLAGNRTSSNGPGNIVLACPKCNSSKHAKDPMDWAGILF